MAIASPITHYNQFDIGKAAGEFAGGTVGAHFETTAGVSAKPENICINNGVFALGGTTTRMGVNQNPDMLAGYQSKDQPTPS